MDCNYIKLLLERYWLCETSLEEEAELQAFFSGEGVPAELYPYKDIFVYQLIQKEDGLGEDFDNRILSMVEHQAVKIKRISFVRKLLPLGRAVALIAVLFGCSFWVQDLFFKEECTDYDYAAYTDTYTDPEVAYKQVSTALMMVSEGINKSQEQMGSDSLKVKTDEITEQQ